MKYQGNKRRIVGEILPIMLENYSGDTFVDAFCGSCSVIEDVPTDYNRIANDKNKYLIAMWRSLTSGKNDFPTTITKEFYTDVKESFRNETDKYSDDLKGWVGYMASFNGKFFSGGYSGHHVMGKNGKARNYIDENIRNINRQISEHNLQGITCYATDYFNIPLPENSLIYCDIPYKNTTPYDFSKGFDYEAFYTWCRNMKEKGHTVFISEYECPDDFECIWEKELTNALNQQVTKKPIEKLFKV